MHIVSYQLEYLQLDPKLICSEVQSCYVNGMGFLVEMLEAPWALFNALMLCVIPYLVMALRNSTVKKKAYKLKSKAKLLG